MSVSIAIGASVSGTYLGQPVSGMVKTAGAGDLPGTRRIQVMLSEPVNVSKSQHMEVMRRSLFLTLDDEGHSVNHKGLRDNIAHIAPAE